MGMIGRGDRMKIKKIISLASIFILSFILVSCSRGSAKTIKSTEVNMPNSISLSHGSFDGYKYRKLKLKEGQKITLNTEVTTEKGELSIKLLDDNGNELYNVKNDKEKDSKTIEIKEDGKYKLQIEGKHSGTCKIDWDIEE